MSTKIDASPREAWRYLRDIPSHVEWMGDAVAIHFLSASRSGVGTRYECETEVGPFHTTDVMEVVEWEEGRAMGVRHSGLVTGEGRFTLRPRRLGRGTVFTWDERLSFPWWLGGPVTGVVGKPVLTRIWKANLRRLKQQVEARS